MLTLVLLINRFIEFLINFSTCTKTPACFATKQTYNKIETEVNFKIIMHSHKKISKKFKNDLMLTLGPKS